MGTPSVCSSMGVFHDSMESDFGSLKSLEGFSLGGGRGLSRFEASAHSTLFNNDRVFGSCSSDAFGGMNNDGEGLSPDGGMSILGSNAELKGVKGFDSEVGKKENLAVLLKNVENVFLQGAVVARSAAENLLDFNHADEMEDERCREEDETSSRYEHSEGEDSMFNYGSDDGSQPNAYYVKNVDSKCDEKVAYGNLMLMNPSVAFGSKDWEDFELDGTEETKGIQLSNNFWERQQPSGENETIIPDFTLARSMSKENLQEHVETKNETVSSNDRPVGDDTFGAGQQSGSIANHHSSTSGLCNLIADNESTDEYLENCSVYNIFEKQCSPVCGPVNMGSTVCEEERENVDIPSLRASCFDDLPVLRLHSDLPPDFGVGEASFTPMDVRTDRRFNVFGGDRAKSDVGHASNSASPWLDNDKGRNNDDLVHSEDEFTSSKVSLL